jgi:hypothetical protein
MQEANEKIPKNRGQIIMQKPTLQISPVEAGIRADELGYFTFPCN